MIHLAACVTVMTIMLTGAGPLRADDPDQAAPQAVKVAVEKGLPLLLKGAKGHIAEKSCFACHNQAIPMLAFTTASQHGFSIKSEDIKEQMEHILSFLDGNRENYLKGRGQGGQADTASYALLTLELGGWKADATTAAVSEYLLLFNKDVDHWKSSSQRPPSEVSPFTVTFLAIRGLKAWGTSEQKERIDKRITAARAWLVKSQAKDTEDRVFRLLALEAAGAEVGDVHAAAKNLAGSQRKDGGWAQIDSLESDAYATGSTLVALHLAGGLATTDQVYQRGLLFLLKNQLEDGSWKVRSRSKPFQPYYESGFPHGKDQFISAAASGWAVTALALACAPDKEAKGE
jgi:hypothetical protein